MKEYYFKVTIPGETINGVYEAGFEITVFTRHETQELALEFLKKRYKPGTIITPVEEEISKPSGKKKDCIRRVKELIRESEEIDQKIRDACSFRGQNFDDIMEDIFPSGINKILKGN